MSFIRASHFVNGNISSFRITRGAVNLFPPTNGENPSIHNPFMAIVVPVDAADADATDQRPAACIRRHRSPFLPMNAIKTERPRHKFNVDRRPLGSNYRWETGSCSYGGAAAEMISYFTRPFFFFGDTGPLQSLKDSGCIFVFIPT